jgi:hypothetical protein
MVKVVLPEPQPSGLAWASRRHGTIGRVGTFSISHMSYAESRCSQHPPMRGIQANGGPKHNRRLYKGLCDHLQAERLMVTEYP